MDEENKLQQVLTAVQGLNARLDDIDGKIHKLRYTVHESVERRLIDFDGRLDVQHERLGKIYDNINAIQSQTARLSEYHTEVMDKLEGNKSDLSYFDQKISEHERELFRIRNA